MNRSLPTRGELRVRVGRVVRIEMPDQAVTGRLLRIERRNAIIKVNGRERVLPARQMISLSDVSV